MRLHSLSSRFFFTLILSATLPFAVFGWFVISGMRERVEGRIASVFLPEKAATAAREIQARVDQIDQACALAVMEVQDTLPADGDDPAGRRLQSYREQIMLLPDLLDRNADMILLAGPEGRVLDASYGLLLDGTTEDSRRDLLPPSVADAPWFEELADPRRLLGKVWLPWSRSPYLHRNPEHRSLDPADYNFGIAYRLGRQEFGGALLVLVRCQEVQEKLDEVRDFLADEAGLRSAEVFLVNDRGVTIAHTDRSRYGARLEPESLRERLPGAEELVAFEGGDGTARMAGLASLGSVAGGRWWVGLYADRAELFSTSRDFAQVLLFAIGVTAVILVFWSLIASHAVLRPVRRLVAATEEVARGDLSVRVPARGRHELADLGRAFNAMTEQLAASRESLKVAERQAAWAEMARQVAHEIKNPLTPMRMSAQLLLRARRENDPRLGELVERLARTVTEQTTALDRIASDFRHFAGAPKRDVERVGADDLLEEVHRSLLPMVEGQAAKLHCRPGAGGVEIEVDREEIRRVFLNLVSNAVEAGGADTEIEVSSEAKDGRVLFRVRDDGPGIPADARAQLFNPYFTTKSSGTGLGLAICHRIVGAHGGQIRLEGSEPGHTVFVVELPCA